MTSTPPAAEWENTTVVEGDLAAFVSDLKREPGGDIGVHGSISLTHTLLEERLIDELRLVIAPAVQMRGRRLFDKAAQTRLSLSRSVISPTGYLLLDYQVGN